MTLLGAKNEQSDPCVGQSRDIAQENCVAVVILYYKG
jgi:hypothetical protein